MTLKFDQAIFHNGNFVLGPLDLQFRAAAVTVVIGPNGSGKSTFLRAAAGLLSAHSGGARLQTEQPHSAHAQLEHPQLEHPNSARVTMPCSDQDLARIAPAQRARLLSFVPQRPESVAGFSVRTSVELGRVAMRADAPRVQLAMQRTGIAALADEPVGHLSEGQRHRVAFARALAQRTADTQLLIVDEPTSALDPSWTRALANELRHCASEGLAVIVATHDFAFAGAVADDIVALSQGKIAATGHACDILIPHILQPIFTIPFRMVEHLALCPIRSYFYWCLA
jgi:iron complex transport system ATP-binding protein